MVKIIKRLTVLFVFLLIVSNVVGQTYVEVDLLLHTRQGEIKNYPLKNHTVITYSDGNLIMTTKDGVEKYPHSSVHKFTFSTKAVVANPTSVTLDKTTAELIEGETLTLTATVKPDDATDKTVTWTSSDETVATVKDGVVSAKKAGKATIIATCGIQSATCEITVKAKVIAASSITLDKTTAELVEGETLTLTATVKPDDATDKTVTWTSSDETVATVKDGVVTAFKPGKATITVTSMSTPSVSATCEVTVVSATGIAAIMAADGTVRADIYSTTGVLVRRAGDSLAGLKPGIYIVNGKKIVVK